MLEVPGAFFTDRCRGPVHDLQVAAGTGKWIDELWHGLIDEQ